MRLGALLAALALLALLYGAWQLVVFVNHRGHGRGTPQYARARDARRFALVAAALALILLAAGWLTPLRDIALT